MNSVLKKNTNISKQKSWYWHPSPFHTWCCWLSADESGHQCEISPLCCPVYSSHSRTHPNAATNAGSSSPAHLAPSLKEWHYSCWCGEATKRQTGAVTLFFSLLVGKRKSSLLWRALQPTAAELIYGSQRPCEEAPSRTSHHPAPLPWGVERSSSSGKMGLSLLFLTTSITKWTSSKMTELLFHPVPLFPPGRVPPQLISLPLLFGQEALLEFFS